MSPTITKIEKSQVEIEGEIPLAIFSTYEKKALEQLLKDFEMPGFRKGKVPETVFRKEIGDIVVLEKMAELALAEHYPKILAEEKIDAIGRPEILLTKLAVGNPLGFKIKTAVLSPITLPDYKKIAKEEMTRTEEAVTVEASEIDAAVLELRRMKAHKELHEKNEDVSTEDHNHPELADENNLPPLDDAFAKSLGNFDSLDGLREKIKENLLLEKKQKAHNKKRVATVDKIIDGSSVEVPAILIDSELAKMYSRLEADIAGMGVKVDDYLVHIKKTKEELLKEWHKDAERRAILELALTEIAKQEKIVPAKEEVDTETKKLLDRYPDADPLRTEAYIENVLRNEKVFAFLENQA